MLKSYKWMVGWAVGRKSARDSILRAPAVLIRAPVVLIIKYTCQQLAVLKRDLFGEGVLFVMPHWVDVVLVWFPGNLIQSLVDQNVLGS